MPNEPLAVVDQQPNVELRAGELGGRQRIQAFAQRRARDGEGVDAGRTCRARERCAATPAISRVGTRTTRSPRAIRNRSNEPETCRQSSSAQTRSPPRPRAQLSTAAKPRAPTWTVCSPSSSPVVAATAAIVCERLWVSAPSTIITLVPSTSTEVDARRTRLAGGAATLLSSHAGHPRPATSDTAKGSQAPTGRQPERESARRRSGPSPRRRTSPTPRITTASLKAAALPSGHGAQRHGRLSAPKEAVAHRWLANAESDHGGAILRRRADAHEPGAGAVAAKAVDARGPRRERRRPTRRRRCTGGWRGTRPSDGACGV